MVLELVEPRSARIETCEPVPGFARLGSRGVPEMTMAAPAGSWAWQTYIRGPLVLAMFLLTRQVLVFVSICQYPFLTHTHLSNEKRNASHGFPFSPYRKTRGSTPNPTNPNHQIGGEIEKTTGCGSKSNHEGTAGFSICLHLPGFHSGYSCLTHTHLQRKAESHEEIFGESLGETLWKPFSCQLISRYFLDLFPVRFDLRDTDDSAQREV